MPIGKKKTKKMLLISVIILLIIAMLVALLLTRRKNNNEEKQEQETEYIEEIYTTKLEDGTKINISEDFNKNKTYGNLSISNIQYTEKDGMSTLLADVTNNGTTKHELEIVKITILGENNEEIVEINPIIEEIDVGETVELTAFITADVINAKDFKIEAEWYKNKKWSIKGERNDGE